MATKPKLEKPTTGGLIYGLSYEEYSALPAANYSMLKHFEKSALQARQEMVAPKSSTKAQSFGIACHAMIFEPDRFKREFARAPKVDKRTTAGQKEWNEFESAHSGQACIPEDEWSQITQISASIQKHALAGQLASLPGKCEVSATWVDSETQVKCRCRMDKFLNFHGWPVIVDLKTTDNAAPDSFAWSAKDWFYDAQAAMYLDGLSEIAKAERRHLIIAAEKKPPYDVVVFEFDDDAIDGGRRLYKKWLRRYKECVDSGAWTGISDGIEPLRIKRRAL